MYTTHNIRFHEAWQERMSPRRSHPRRAEPRSKDLR